MANKRTGLPRFAQGDVVRIIGTAGRVVCKGVVHEDPWPKGDLVVVDTKAMGRVTYFRSSLEKVK